MTPARLQTIEEIFHSALDREPGEMGAFLDTACNGDQVLRGEVESYLAWHEEAAVFIETTPVGLATKILDSTPQPDLLVGQRIGHYELVKRIGAGGMGEVYLATDITAGRKAALKLLPLRFTGDAERLRRFAQEAHAVVALNHPNILTVYEIGEDRSTHYIASELIEGETLRDHLARGPLEVEEAIEVAIQVASALAAAHAAGIVHRDIKPDNIMLRPDGYVKVLDFGIAKLAEPEAAPATGNEDPESLLETRAGSILGTVRYLSPEQARGAAISPSSDIWSLGVVLYEMLAGSLSFGGNDSPEIMSAILSSEPPTLAEQIPKDLQQIVGRMLRKEPGERYPSARELVEALKRMRRQVDLLTYGHNKDTSVGVDSRSLVVLPFANQSGDPAQEHFSDGLTEELINRLGRIPSLLVIGRNSSFALKGGTQDSRAIGQILGVANLLEGSVRKFNDRVRITVGLVRAADGSQLWTENYDRELKDVFAVQEEIATAVGERLRVTLLGAAGTAQPARAVADTEIAKAHHLYFCGRYHWGKRTEAGLQAAIKDFNAAIDIDPGNARSWAGLADCYTILGCWGYESPHKSYPKAKAAAERALELDDTLSEAHVSLAVAKKDYYWDWAGAEQ